MLHLAVSSGPIDAVCLQSPRHSWPRARGDSWCLHGAVFSAASCVPARACVRACVRARLHVYRLTLDPARQVAGSGVAEDKITILGKLKNCEQLCRKTKKKRV